MLHRRQKRYLHFPDKSSFTMTLTLLRQTAVTFPLLNTLHELDFGFRLPQHPEEIFYKKYTKPKQRERREIHQSMQHVAQLLGSGSKCCLSQLVHSRSPQQSEHSEEDLLTDILTIVFDSLSDVNSILKSIVLNNTQTTKRDSILQITELNKLTVEFLNYQDRTGSVIQANKKTHYITTQPPTLEYTETPSIPVLRKCCSTCTLWR
ncbi:hypothetical protein M8J75_010950 [Diaphorina citri]|nr:hypothetical protein M8J75_010950 [Diaphorina citri]